MSFSTKKPTLVFVSNGITPYGVHFLKRIAHEMPDYTLRTIYTSKFSMGNWGESLPSEINAMILGKGDDANKQSGIVAIREDWARYQQLLKEIKKSSPVAVLILGYSSMAHILAINWCYKHRLPCLMFADSNILGDHHQGIKARFKFFLVKRIVSRCRAILPCGTLGSRYFQKYGARPEQIFFSPVEPDYSLIQKISLDMENSIAKEFQLEPNRRRLIYSGRLVAVKRLDLLIDAFVKLADNRPEWDLLIVGGGPLEAELKLRVPKYLQKRVFWTGFIGSQEDMAFLYRHTDVLVLPSDYEPWALVINEAMCAGLALVCSDVVGAAAELLRDGVNGRIFKAGSILSLYTALLDVTEESNFLRYREASPQILDSWRKMADPVVGLRQALDFCFKTVTA